MSEKQYTPGHFVWRELMTTDVGVAKTFYGEVCGWSYGEMPMGDAGNYTLIMVGGRPVGGIMAVPMPGMPSHWSSYVSVEDVDAAADRAQAQGGKLVAGPSELSVGRFAVVVDPTGAALTLWRAKDGDAPPAQPGVGEFCWETLVTPDVAQAQAFYAAVLGWKQGIGPSPEIPVFAAGEVSVADIQHSTDMPSHWATYVVVPHLATARDRVTRLGGQVVVPLIEVPGVGNIAFIADPTGGMVGLFEVPTGA